MAPALKSLHLNKTGQAKGLGTTPSFQHSLDQAHKLRNLRATGGFYAPNFRSLEEHPPFPTSEEQSYSKY